MFRSKLFSFLGCASEFQKVHQRAHAGDKVKSSTIQNRI